MYNWITLLYTRNSHDIVNQLYFNKIKHKTFNSNPFLLGTCSLPPLWLRFLSLFSLLTPLNSPFPPYSSLENTKYISTSWPLYNHEVDALPPDICKTCFFSSAPVSPYQRSLIRLFSVSFPQPHSGSLCLFLYPGLYFFIVPFISYIFQSVLLQKSRGFICLIHVVSSFKLNIIKTHYGAATKIVPAT